LLHDSRSKEAVRCAEEYADGLLTANDLAEAANAAWDAHLQLHDAEYHASKAAVWVAEVTAEFAASETADAAISATVCDPNDPEEDGNYQASSLRCIFGNPFRPVTFDLSWLTSTVVALATGIYQDRAFDRMPILADALQDAGCENEDILNHCRGEGVHVRGCWLVDLILGKE
jgi:hypothetical protein